MDGTSTSQRVAEHVMVDVAPRAGMWEEDSVNWKQASSWLTVNAGGFHILTDSDGLYQQKYEIDVFPTMKKLLKGTRPIQQSLTFSISSKSGRLFFYSREAANGSGPSLDIEIGEEGVSRPRPSTMLVFLCLISIDLHFWHPGHGSTYFLADACPIHLSSYYTKAITKPDLYTHYSTSNESAQF